jgi:hypothetical protein
MRYSKFLSLFCVYAASLMLSGCTVSEIFSKKAPDEFQILTRAPLNMPPDYDIRPPLQGAFGAGQSSEKDSKALAKETLLGKRKNVSSGILSKGESMLIEKTGGNRASSDISKTLDFETGQRIEKEKSVVDDIVFWEDRKPGADTLDVQKAKKDLENQSYVLRKK